MVDILNDIIELLTGGLTQMATGIGTGLQEFVKQLFVSGAGTESDPYALTMFGSLIAIFGGISLAVSIGRLIFNWIISLGGSH